MSEVIKQEKKKEKEKNEFVVFPADLPVIKEGFLQKKGGERRNWKTRWFVLKKNYLGYFKKPLDVTPKGAIQLNGVSVGVSTRKTFCFAIRTSQRTYFLSAQNKAEQDLWMAALEQCIENEGTEPPPPGSFDEPATPAKRTLADMSRGRMAMSTIALPTGSTPSGGAPGSAPSPVIGRTNPSGSISSSGPGFTISPLSTSPVSNPPSDKTPEKLPPLNPPIVAPTNDPAKMAVRSSTFLTYHRARPTSMLHSHGTLSPSQFYNSLSQSTPGAQVSPVAPRKHQTKPEDSDSSSEDEEVRKEKEKKEKEQEEKNAFNEAYLKKLLEAVEESIGRLTDLQTELTEFCLTEDTDANHPLKKALLSTSLVLYSLSKAKKYPQLVAKEKEKEKEEKEKEEKAKKEAEEKEKEEKAKKEAQEKEKEAEKATEKGGENTEIVNSSNDLQLETESGQGKDNEKDILNNDTNQATSLEPGRDIETKEIEKGNNNLRTSTESLEEDLNTIYRIDYFKEHIQKVIICQNFVKKWLSQKPKSLPQEDTKGETPSDTQQKELKQQKKRLLLIAEILSTEKSYVASLKLLVEKFSEPLWSIMKKFPNNNLGVTTENLTKIFANVEDILKFNSSLLKELEAEATPQIGKIFQCWARAQDLYKEYCSNYNISISTLEQMNQNAAFEKFIKQCENNAGTGLTLSSFLIMPVQRIPRYVMLLEELMHNTPRADKESMSLRTSLANMKEIADSINEAKRKVDSMEKMRNIRLSISGIEPELENNIFTSALSTGNSRVFMREAEFTKLPPEAGETSPDHTPSEGPKQVHLFMFNDMIIITVPKKSSFFNEKKRPYNFVSLIEIEKIKSIQDTHSAVSMFLNSAHLLEITMETEKYMFTTNNKFQRDDWMKEIRKLLPSNIRKQKYKVLKFH